MQKIEPKKGPDEYLVFGSQKYGVKQYFQARSLNFYEFSNKSLKLEEKNLEVSLAPHKAQTFK